MPYIDDLGSAKTGDPTDMTFHDVMHLTYSQYALENDVSKTTLAQLFHDKKGADFQITLETSGQDDKAVCGLFQQAASRAGYDVNVSSLKQAEYPADQAQATTILHVTNIRSVMG